MLMASIRKRTWRGGKTAYVVDWIDRTGRRHNRQFRLYREADKFRRETERQLDANSFRPDADKMTLRNVSLEFLEHCTGRQHRGERMTRHCLAGYRGHVHNHILASAYGIGETTLARLTASTLGDFRDKMRGAGVSVPTTRKVLSTLHGILQFAIGKGWLAINVAHGVRVIGRRDEGSKKIKPPSKEAVAALLAEADDDLRLVVMFAVATGGREQWALRWRHLDLAGAEVIIETRVDAYGEEDTTKTEAGVRQIPLSRDLASALKAWRLRSPHSDPDDLVFPSRRGGYTCHSNLVKRSFKPLASKAGVQLDNWHALRHYAVSTWIEAGLSPKTVQTFAGHSSLEVTMSRYGHLFKDTAHQAAMNRISDELAAKMQHTTSKV